MKTSEKNNAKNINVEKTATVATATQTTTAPEKKKTGKSKPKPDAGTAIAPTPETTPVVAKEAYTPKFTEDGLQITDIHLSLIDLNPANARKHIDEVKILELAESVKTMGVIQAVTVRPKGDKYELVCGERRYRASLIAEMSTIPAVIRELNDEDAIVMSLTENIQREDLAPMDEAVYLQELVNLGGKYTVEYIAITYCKAKSYVYNYLSLNRLIPAFQDMFRENEITLASALVLAKYDHDIQEEIHKNHFAEGVYSYQDYRQLNASALARKIDESYTRDLTAYNFDKTECRSCRNNSEVAEQGMFPEMNGCGKCSNRNCLEQKNGEYMTEQARKIADRIPKVAIIGNPKEHLSVQKQNMLDEGAEFKAVNTYGLQKFPEKPEEPKAEEFTDIAEFETAQEKYSKECARYEKTTADLEEKAKTGHIRAFADIDGKNVRMYYREVNNASTKSTEQLIADWEKSKEDNDRKMNETVVESFKDLFRTELTPQGEYTTAEDNFLFYFLLTFLRRNGLKGVGLKDRDYWGSVTPEKRLEIVRSVTPEQKAVIMRDFIISQLMKNSSDTIDQTMLIQYAKMHFTDKANVIYGDIQQEFEQKNARLDEKIQAARENLKPAGKKDGKPDKADAGKGKFQKSA